MPGGHRKKGNRDYFVVVDYWAFVLNDEWGVINRNYRTVRKERNDEKSI